MNKKQTIRLNESQLRRIVKESVKRVLTEENDIIKTFKHCHISKHPLKDEYMVVNDTFKNIPPFFGTKGECEKAAIAADKSPENHLNTLIGKARKDGYSEDEICSELDNMINGGSWVKFETNKKLGGSQKINKLKKEGKC